MNINGYIKLIGPYTFAEREFNDVDALVLGEFSYLNLELLNLPEGSSFCIKDIPSYMIDPLCNDQMDAEHNKVMLRKMIESKRYQDIYVKYIKKYDSKEDDCHFFAVTIFFEDKMYISYRGTDLTLRAWKEDLSMCFRPIVPSQNIAYEYLKEVLSLEKDKKYYSGGHSKGGNLAIYAPLYIDDDTNQRLVKAYSFDGPGFYDNTIIEKINCWPFKKQIVKIMPKNALVGILLNTTIDGIIVDATSHGALQHDPFNWKVLEDGVFKRCQYRLRRSFLNEYVLRKWLSEMNEDDKKLIVNLLFDSFENLEVSVLKLKKEWWATIRKVIKGYKKLNKKDRKRFRKLAGRLLTLNTNAMLGIVPKDKKKVA